MLIWMVEWKELMTMDHTRKGNKDFGSLNLIQVGKICI